MNSKIARPAVHRSGSTLSGQPRSATRRSAVVTRAPGATSVAAVVKVAAGMSVAAIMLLGCNHQARKSFTSKGTAVPSDQFESEFPSSPAEPTTSDETGSESSASVSVDVGSSPNSSEGASSGGATSSGAPSTAAPGSGASVTSDAASSANDGTSVRLGSAVLFQVLNVDLPCGAKVAGEQNYLCTNTECTAPLSLSQPWALPDDPTVIYDVEVALTGNVETFPNVSGAVVATNDALSVISATEPTPGEANVYELQVGDANYVLNAGDEAGLMFPLENLVFTLKGIPGGTNVALKVMSSDCNQVSICQMQGSCSDEAVPDDGQHLEVMLTATST